MSLVWINNSMHKNNKRLYPAPGILCSKREYMATGITTEMRLVNQTEDLSFEGKGIAINSIIQTKYILIQYFKINA